ncbi:MAG: ATPase [Thermoleophilia bacterium]|nr:ATPase [Thermoleophilia bacterium]
MHSSLVHVPSVQATSVLAEGHLTQAFDIGVMTSALSHVRRRHIAMRHLTYADIEALCEMKVETSIDSMGQLLLVGSVQERELVEVSWHYGNGHVRVATDDAATADDLLDRLCERLQAEKRPEDPRVPIWFWTLTEHGPEPMVRRLYAPAWDEIAGNYVGPLSDALAKIMDNPPDSARGIALWRGAPGTGKTTALRALAHAWRDHVDIHVIVDPEVFLGERASYLVQVLFGHDVDEHWDGADGSAVNVVFADTMGHGPGVMPPVHYASMSSTPAPTHSRAKLIVLEDAGELISSDARVSAGQALSRLLNLTDGMLGQGSNVSVLVTTNEPIDRLHDAVARPGRSWAHLEFTELPEDEANAWLEQHGSDDRVDAPATLAELYGIVRGDQVVTLDTLEH